MDFLEAAEKLLSIDSSADVGNAYACQFLSSLARELGLESRKESFVEDGVEQAILYIWRGKNASFDNLFWSNLQTNDPAPYSYWSATDSNPFRLSIQGERVFGLGANSGKLDFLTRIYALAAMSRDNPSLQLVGGYGHFLRKEGAKQFVKNLDGQVKLLVVSEPSSMEWNTNYSGRVVVRILLPFSETEKSIRKKYFSDEVTATQTKIFHAEPHFSFHANYKNEVLKQTQAFLEKLPSNSILLNIEWGDSPYLHPAEGMVEMDLSDSKEQDLKSRLLGVFESVEEIFDRRFSKYIKKYDLEDFPTYNLGFLRTIDEGIEIEGCFYLTHGVDLERVKTWLAPLSQQQAQINIQHFHAPNKWHSTLDILRGLYPEAVINTKLQHIPSDTSYFLAKGLPAVGFGSGKSSGFRLMNEYNELNQIQQAKNVYQDIFERL